MTTDFFNPATATKDELTNERARRSVQAFRAMQAGLTGYARAITGNKQVTVEVSRDSARTDGKRIYYKPPIELGDLKSHKRTLCDKRDPDTLRQRCDACRVRETVLIAIYHEIAHIAFETFAEPSNHQKIKAVERAIEEAGTKHAVVIRANWDTVPSFKKGDYLNLSSLISPFLPVLINALEDARVDENMFKARRGTKIMFDAFTLNIFREGVEQADGTRMKWSERPLNSQAILGVFVLACRYKYEGWFSPEVETAMADKELCQLVARVDTLRSAEGSYSLAFPILQRLRELGFCRGPEDAEDEVQEPEPESEPEQEDNQDEEQQDDDHEPPSDDHEDQEDDSDPAEGEPDADKGGTNVEQDSSEDADEGEPSNRVDTQGDEGDDGAASGSGDDDDESGAGDSDSDDSDSDKAAGDDPSGSAEGTSDEAGQGEGSGDAAPSEDSSDGGGEEESDVPNQGDSAGGDEGSDGGSEGTEDSGGSAGTSEDDTDRPSDEDEDQSSDRSSGRSLPEGESDSKDGGLTDGEDSNSYRSDSQGSPEHDDLSGSSEEDSQRRSEPDRDSRGDSDLDDADKGEGGIKVNKINTLEMGTPEEALEDVHVFGQHEMPELPRTIDEINEIEAIDRAILQSEYFEKPSTNINGVREHKYKTRDDGASAWIKDPYTEEYYKSQGIITDLDIPESVLGPALLEMRRTFSDNQRSNMEHHLRSGKINARVLGKRAWAGDDRLFQKKRIPGRKSYAVLLGIDASGSTLGQNIALAKRAAMAQAELCNRAGIDFAVYAHSANSDPGMGYARGLSLDIYEIKSFEAAWDTNSKAALDDLGADCENLDGHTIEYYRKMIERHPATDKIILYYSDGKMPAANAEEELEILQREIAYCKRKAITLMGVGIRTDSPRRHGLNTVRVDSDSDVNEVVRHLESALLHRR